MIAIHSNPQTPKFKKFLVPIMLAFMLIMQTGCASWNKLFSGDSLFGSSYDNTDTPESLAMDGLEKFNHGEYDKALKIFDDLKGRFPFSKYSMLAELKSADSHYYLENYPEALVLYREFEEMHPTNEALPYVIFQKGLCYYKQIGTIDRDTSVAIEAIQAFSFLLRSYPNSPYEVEARARVMAANNFLANHEFYVANFYVQTKSYDQAQVRLNYLLNNFPDTNVAPRAHTLLQAIKEGKPPQPSWLDWLPSLPLPDWRIFTVFQKENDNDK